MILFLIPAAMLLLALADMPSGYYVFMAQKRFVQKKVRDKKGMSKKLQKKYQARE